MSKVRAVVVILKNKSDFFLGMYDMFEQVQDVSDNILEYIYNVTMRLVQFDQVDRQLTVQKQHLLQDAQLAHIQKLEADEKADVEAIL
jgi:hypothetical protein